MRILRAAMSAITILVATTTANAQWIPTSTPSNTSGVYWDNLSYDGTSCNIGYVLTGVAGRPDTRSAQCTNQRPMWLPYTGQTPTLQKETAGFSSLFTGMSTLTIYGDIAGMDQTWGWYDAVTGVRTNLNGLAVNSPLFVGSNEHAWGLFIQLVDGTYVNSLSNQFAVFGFGTLDNMVQGDYIFGVEDITTAGGDRDYNDVVGRLQVGVVPEPSTYLTLGTGLLILGFLKLKKKAI